MSGTALVRGGALAAAGAALGVACGLALALAGETAGLAVVLLPVIGVAAAVLLTHPRIALAALAVPVVLLENDPSGFLPERALFYERQAGLPFPATILLLGTLLGAVALDVAGRRRSLRLPGPFGVPLLIIGLAAVGGVATAAFAGADRADLVNDTYAIAFLVVLPFLARDVLADARTRRIAVVVAAALAAVKGLEGIAAWLTGEGRVIGSTVQSFYQPTANWLLLASVLVLLGALLLRVRLAPWAMLLGPVALLALALSFRRSFWIGAVVGVAFVIVAVGGRRSLRLVPLVVAVAAALWAAIALAGPTVETAIVERGRSLAPSALDDSVEDRYRLVEQRDVVREIAAHPITGLGLGVPWEAHDPLPVEHEGGRLYTHVAALWYWLKLGLLGVIGYVLLLATTVVTALRVSRRARDRLVRAVSLGLAAAFTALAAIELTASFTGVDLRLTVVLSIALGWLAAEAADLPQRAPPAR